MPGSTPDWIFGKISDPHWPFGMNLVSRILANKIVALAVLSGIGVFLLIIPALHQPARRKSDRTAASCLGRDRYLDFSFRLEFDSTPGTFPPFCNRQRAQPASSLSACRPALRTIHFSCHLLYQGDLEDVLQSFSKPFIWFGLTGLTILVLLALTSNNWAVRKLGGKRWKLLHRLAYLAAIVLIYHQSIAGKGHWYIARWLLFLLVALEGARIAKKIWFKKPSSARCPTKAKEVPHSRRLTLVGTKIKALLGRFLDTHCLMQITYFFDVCSMWCALGDEVIAELSNGMATVCKSLGKSP